MRSEGEAGAEAAMEVETACLGGAYWPLVPAAVDWSRSGRSPLGHSNEQQVSLTFNIKLNVPVAKHSAKKSTAENREPQLS